MMNASYETSRRWGAAVWGRVLIVACVVASPAAGQVKHNGRLERLGPFRTLYVWGTPQEMGFAHGYLLATDIVADLPKNIAASFGENTAAYEGLLGSLGEFIQCPGHTGTEIQGIYDGVCQRLGDAPRLELLGRKLRVEDLIFFNAMDTMRAFGCSGFAVWDKPAGDAGVIAGRNFDYAVADPQVLGHQMILVRQPKERKQVATITWPGYIGAFTGFNEDGLALFLHDGSGPQALSPQGRYAPVALLLADFLEQTRGNVMANMRNMLRPLRSPYSYIIRLIAPATDDGGTPAMVYHLDASGPGFSPIHEGKSVSTNHYLGKEFEPQGNADADSIGRYKTLEARLDVEELSNAAAWEALDAVAASSPQRGTLHALVLYPERKRIELAFANWGETFVPATKNPHTLLTFAEIFKKPPAETRPEKEAPPADDSDSP